MTVPTKVLVQEMVDQYGNYVGVRVSTGKEIITIMSEEKDRSRDTDMAFKMKEIYPHWSFYTTFEQIVVHVETVSAENTISTPVESKSVEEEQDKKYDILMLGIDYDTAYNAVTISNGIRIGTGDPVYDFRLAQDYAYANAYTVMQKSSVGHFVWDNDGYYIAENGELLKRE